MPDRPDRDRLLDILEEIAIIEKALDGYTPERFVEDGIAQRVVLHALQTIGEAANNISDATRQTISNAPWPRIRGLRNRIVHGYFGLDLGAIWRTATEDAPALREMIEQSGLL